MSTPEDEILDLIDRASVQQSSRDINQLERLVDVGDRIVAQQAMLMGAKKDLSSDPTEAEQQ
jgi:hypothetical protein